jgi:PAS domain S-box-containing protein
VTAATAGVRAAQAVAKSERRFRAMIENSTEGIALTDRDGKAFYLSPAGAKLFAPHSGKFAAEIHPEDSEAVNEVFLWLKAHPGKSRPMEYRAKARTGQWHSFESTVTNLLEDPAVEAIVGNFRDVTERKRLTEQFLHAQKMEAVGRLAGGIAHDFNNVLCVILSYAEMIIGDLKPEDSLRTEMEEIRRAGLRAADLTRQLLAFSRQQVLEARVLDLNQSVGKMEKILRRLLGEDVELTMHPAPGLWSIKADAGQIEQTVMNLAVNARDAMPQGGALILETANIELGDEDVYAHLGVIPGSYVMLSVTDTGTGMDKETQARIFEPFFTTKEKGKGTGLGLATVFGIVKQSGGHISVDSEPGKGTTFRVYFPRVVGDVSAARVSEAPGPLSERGTETVLLVEDDDQVRTLARSILRRNGYIVLEAPNGGEGLLICEQHPSKIHLLLTDVILPRMSGRQLAERLTKMRPEMKVLFMSGYTEDATLNRSVLESGTAFLQKPLTPDSLARKVREVLREGTREGREKATRAEPKTPTC